MLNGRATTAASIAVRGLGGQVRAAATEDVEQPWRARTPARITGGLWLLRHGTRPPCGYGRALAATQERKVAHESPVPPENALEKAPVEEYPKKPSEKNNTPP